MVLRELLLSSKKTQSRYLTTRHVADFFTNKLNCPTIKEENVGITRCETKAKQKKKPTND